MTPLFLDTGEGAVKLIVGFFKLLGFAVELLASGSAVGNVAGLLLLTLAFVGLVVFLRGRRAR